MWAIFDLNGTLVDPSVLLDPGALGVEALDEANMMAMVTVIAGRETTFAPLLDAALRRGLIRAGLDPALAEGAMARLPSMPAYPDVPEALAALRAGGFSLAVLTQSALEAAETVLGNAGLRESFDLVLSAPASGAFKPEDLAYRYALEQAARLRTHGSWPDTGGTSPARPTRAFGPPGSPAPTSPTRTPCRPRTSSARTSRPWPR